MNITVINGSPKGSSSITSFTAKFIQKNFPTHSFKILNLAQKLRFYEQNPNNLHELEDADFILFSYPIYTFMAPSQLHRIFELIKDHNINLSGKWCSQITTSKHVYDFTAHRYIEDIATDLKMKPITGLSADMDDLLSNEGQKTAIKFWQHVEFSIENNIEIPYHLRATNPSSPSPKINLQLDNNQQPKSTKFDTVLITCSPEYNSNLDQMIKLFKSTYPYAIRTIDLSQYPFQGGCIGCLKCSSTEKCFYNDGFDEFLRNEIQNADACIYALNIKDHSFGSTFKKYQDRHFCNGHRTKTMGKPLGFITAGKISNEENLKMYINAIAQVGHNQMTGIASDEFNAANDIKSLALETSHALENKFLLPMNFLGIGGHKIFRDLIYELRGMMQADHKFYKQNGFYNDFPQRRKARTFFMYIVGFMMKNKKFNTKIQQGIILPYKKLIT